jgi:hypothetical protein
VICPKLCILNAYITKNSKINKFILGDKINTIIDYRKLDSNAKSPNIIKFGFDNQVQVNDFLHFFYGTLTRYNNTYTTLLLPVEDLSNTCFSGKMQNFIGMNNIPNNYSKVKISTETFDSLIVENKNDINNINLGFSEIHIVKSESKKIKNFIFNNSACL